MKRVHRFVGVVTAVGTATFVALALNREIHLDLLLRPEILVFLIFVVLGELLPIEVPRRDEVEEVTTSTTFSFALLLTAGLVPAMAAQMIASLVADTAGHKPLWKAMFNASQYALTLVCANVVLAVGGLHPANGESFTGNDLHIVAVAAVVYFIVNNALAGTALALAQDVPVVRFLKHDLAFQAGSAGVLLALAPIVVAAADFSLALVPLMALPLAAVWFAGKQAIKSEHQALHDRLTELPNRLLYIDRTQQAIRSTARHPETYPAVMVMDVDRLKEINDTLGHDSGDALIVQVGERIRAASRLGDTVARLGGDEFAILVPGVVDRASAARIAQRFVDSLSEPFELGDMMLAASASIGIALYPEDGEDADTLLRKADIALNQAKEQHAPFQVYAPERDIHTTRRLRLMADLRSAIENKEIISFYQPKADVVTRRIVGVESLARWIHPELGLIAPNEFITLAEHSGLMRQLTLSVLDNAAAQWRRWHERGIELDMAVNLSAHNLADPRLLEEVDTILLRHDMPAGKLELEITESCLMSDARRSMRTLGSLDERGLRLAIDDFGTGYSSLAYLKDLPVDTLKIDRSFISTLADDTSNTAIVRSTIALGHNLDLTLVAEGVEDEATWQRLVDLECDLAQGFYLSKPLPSDELEPLLATAGARLA
jgi:diguanylate cyclase (GGDEF)-like protein